MRSERMKLLRPKWKEKGVRGGGVKEAQSRPFFCSPPIEFGGTGKPWALTLNVAYHLLFIVQRHQLIPLLEYVNI
jgi:hypothetical protein